MNYWNELWFDSFDDRILAKHRIAGNQLKKDFEKINEVFKNGEGEQKKP